MDSLRLILLGIGVAIILAIYLYEKVRRRNRDQRYGRFGGAEEQDFVPRYEFNRPRPAYEEMDDLEDDDEADEPERTRPSEALRDITGELEQLESIIAGRDDDIVQMEIGDLDVVADRAEAKPVPVEPDMILMINLFATDGRVFSGVDILDATIHHEMVYGDMQFFYRYDQQGNTVFTMASAINPGTFPLSEMEVFTTRGLVFFMSLPCHGDPLANFDAMLSTAREMENDLHGQLYDERRSVLTRQGIDIIRGNITEYKLRNAREASLGS